MPRNGTRRGSRMANLEDEIRFRRHLEAANTEEEYNGQNNTHRLNSRERVRIRRYLQEGEMDLYGIGFRSGGRGRNMNFFGQRLSQNQPPLHLIRYDNSEVRSGWNRNQSEERHPQIERNQVSFGRFHGHSESRVRHISRSHGQPSRRSYSHVRSTPVNSDRPHHDRSVRRHHEHSDGRHHDHSVRRHHEHSDGRHDDHSIRRHHEHSDGRHHDHSGRPHHDHSDRHSRDHSGRPHHDHSGRFHLGHTGRAHPSHSGIAHQDHAERAQLSHVGLAHHDHRGRAHLNYTRLVPYNSPERASVRHAELAHRGHRVGAHPNYTGLAHHNHAGRINHDHSGRAHNNRTWRSHSHDERYRDRTGRGERIQTSSDSDSDSDSEIDRFSAIREMTEYLLDQEQQRNELINLNRGMIEEGYRSSAESDDSSDSLWRYEVDADFLNGRYTSIRTIPRHPKGVRLNFNIGACNNQTSLSLHTRFTILRNLGHARMNNMNHRLRRHDD